jgi:heme exporter protein C
MASADRPEGVVMDKPSRALQILNVVTVLAVFASLVLIFFVAPRELTMGEVQRIFYWHVPAAWMSMVAFAITALTGLIYLLTRRRAWDMISRSSVEIGLLFTLMTIISGSTWARPAWNTWWTWDPRLTTYTIMALIYVAYGMLRQGIEDPERSARFGAVYGLVGFVSVPITFFSIRWWRTIHPVVIGSPSAEAEGTFAMTDSMLAIFLLCNVVFPLLYTCLLANRVRLERLYERVEQARARLNAPEGEVYAAGAAAARHAEYR